MGNKEIRIKELMKLIPHRYPFLLIDRVLDYEEGKWIKAIKNLTINESFFQGHFPTEPIMPGVLMIEAMAQAGGILALMSAGAKEKLAFFMTINNVKFRKPVVPGDQLVFNVEIVKVVRASIVKTRGTATVDGQVVAEGDLMFSIIDKEEK